MRMTNGGRQRRIRLEIMRGREDCAFPIIVHPRDRVAHADPSRSVLELMYGFDILGDGMLRVRVR